MLRGGVMMKARVGIAITGAALLFGALNSWAAIYSWFYIPHLAIGGGYTSYLTVWDTQGYPSRNIWVYLYDDNGSALLANVEGQGQNISNFTFTLGAFSEKAVAITGSSLTTGSIQVKADGMGLLNASLRFTTTDSSGNATDVVGILPADPNFNWTVAVEKRSATDYTGFAIANPWTTQPTVTVDFYQNGNRVPGTTPVILPTLGPLAHTATFVHSLFPSAWSSFSGTGTLRISSTGSVSVTALRGDGTQYSSLQAEPETQWWNWTYTDGGLIQSGSWSWRFNDCYTYTLVGFEQNSFNAGAVRLRGMLDSNANIFLAEWSYANSDGTTGAVIWTGTLGKQGSTNVISGRRIQLQSKPEICRHAEDACKSKSCIRGQ
jgi:hypothetical protein